MENMEFALPLEKWYLKNKRNLPWRDTTDPYVIWVSEIILQQTRVAQGLDYFNRFMSRFPDVVSLAEAEEDEVLKYWQGLGYYSRARNLHTAARQIVRDFGGRFPDNNKEVRSLKGIGEYTAAAICSFAYRQPYAVVDGNVYRVLARLFDIDVPIDSTQGRKIFAKLASELLDKKHPDLYNQAIMELGALQCVPRSPRCELCPLVSKCLSVVSGRVDKLPVKLSKPVVKPRFFNYFCVFYGKDIWIRQRTGEDIWKNLYEFVLIETDREYSFEELQHTEEYDRLFRGAGHIKITALPLQKRHVLSHRIINACFYTLEIENIPEGLSEYMRIPYEELDHFAISRLTHIYVEQQMRHIKEQTLWG